MYTLWAWDARMSTLTGRWSPWRAAKVGSTTEPDGPDGKEGVGREGL